MRAGASAPVLITGASVGLGADFARIFAGAGHPVALVARDEARLNAVAAELGTPGGRAPIVIAMDLREADAPGVLAARLAAENFTPGVLVNNAGYGLNGRSDRLDRAGQLGMVDLNIRALTDLTLTFLPGVRAAGGGILNVASIAAFLPGPGMAVYYASKAFVLSFSEALHHELAGDGVVVTALCPGPTETEFFERAGGSANRLKQFSMMKSMDVAQAGYDGLKAGKRVIVPGLSNKIMSAMSALTPHALLLNIISRVQLGR